MFEMTAADPRVTHGKYRRLIVESEHVTPNADIEYEQGYLDASGNFVSLGVAAVHLEDSPEIPAEVDGETIIREAAPAGTDYTDFLAALRGGTTGYSETLEQILIQKVGAK